MYVYSLVGKCDTFWQLCVVGYCCFGRDKGNKHHSPEEDSSRGREGVLVGAYYKYTTYLWFNGAHMGVCYCLPIHHSTVEEMLKRNVRMVKGVQLRMRNL